MKKRYLFFVLAFAVSIAFAGVALADLTLNFTKAAYYEAVEAYESGQMLTSAQYNILREDGYFATSETDDMGGPDGYGYYYIDSGEEGGPIYNWIDISETGMAHTEMGDDDYLNVELPWAFPFYGADYNDVYISSNGYLAFGEGGDYTDFSNDPIPSAITPDNYAAPFWDDLNPSAGETATLYYGEDEDGNFVVTYEMYPAYFNTDNLYTFQAVLYENGDILYQYSDMEELDIDNETIGIENADGTDGLQVSYSADPEGYPYDGLAILIYMDEIVEPDPLTLVLTPIPYYPWEDLNFPIWQGGWFQYLVEITNNTDEEIVYDAWVKFAIPDRIGGEEQDYLLKYFEDLVIGPGEYVAVTPWQCVPPCEHDWWGTYTMIARLGDYPDDVWATDEFDIYIEPDEDFITIPNGDADFNLDGFTTFGWDWPNDDYSTSTVVPTEFAIDQVYPNPFNPTTNVAITLPLASELKVSVFNVMGQEVARLANGRFAEGYHNFSFDAANLASGIYFVQATVPGKMNEMRKVMLLK